MSLRLRAVLIAGVALVVLWVVAAGWMMQGVQGHLNTTLDERLAMSARMVSGLLQQSALQASPAMVGSELDEAVRISGGKGIACQIRSLHGGILAQTNGAPGSAFGVHESGYDHTDIDGETWRTYTLREGEYQITTADRIDERNMLNHQMLIAGGIPFLIALIGGLLALWIGIDRGLAPLSALRRTLKEKNTSDMSPVEIGRPPAELRPVLGAMNELLARLAQALSSQRAFTDAAAHELRTPLTAIDTHLQIVRLTDGATAAASLQQAEEGVRRLSRTLNQMMTLVRTDAIIDERDGCDSVQAVMESVVHRLPAAAGDRVILDVDAPDQASPIPKSMLEAAVRNLVDNALQYSPAHSQVTIHFRDDTNAEFYLIEVMDRGPGLSPEQIAQVGRRFWRGDQGRHGTEGAGLGLSIVQAIVDRFGGSLSLQPREGGGLVAGLRVPTLSRIFR